MADSSMKKAKINHDFLINTINTAIRNDSRIPEPKYEVEVITKSSYLNANWEADIRNAPMECMSVLNEICKSLSDKYDVIWD